MAEPSAGSSDANELERLRRALAEARLESDARTAELRALYEQTRQLRQWRADTYLQIQKKKTQTLWRALSALRGQNPLDAFVPPPLADGSPADRTDGPPSWMGGIRRSGECVAWDAAGLRLLRAPLNLGATGETRPTLFCESLITHGQNPLGALRSLLSETAVGTEVWLFEPDGLNAPPAEAATIQHLLLDERETGRSHARHGVDAALLKAVADELCRDGRAEFVESGTQSCGANLFHAVLLRRREGTVPADAAEQAPSRTVASPLTGATLVLLHANPFDPGAGGTEQFVLARTRALMLPHTVILFPNGPREIVAAEIRHGAVDARRTYTFALRTPLPQYSDRHPEAEDLVLWIARAFGASSAIVDHLLNWPLRLPGLLRKAGLRYAMVLHDFYAVCPNFNLVDLRSQTPCSTHYGGDNCAEGCLAMHFAATLHVPGPRDLAGHQETMAGILKDAEALICPDRSVAKRVAAALNTGTVRASEIHVLPHGMDAQTDRDSPGKAAPSNPDRLRIGLLGNLNSAIKGAPWLQTLLNSTALMPIDWHVFGRLDAELPSGAVATLTQHGPYEQRQIVNLLRNHAIDLTLFASRAEETFSLTLSESFCARIPALVPNLGALGNRVAESGFGWTVLPNDLEAVRAQLETLLLKPAELRAVKEKLAGFTHRSTAENAADYRRVLGAFFNTPAPVPATPDSSWLKQALERNTALLRDYEASHDDRWGLEPAQCETPVKALTLTPSHFTRGRRHLLALEFSSAARGRLEVFFETLAEPLGAGSQVFRRAVEAGRSRICVELSHPLLRGSVRVGLGELEFIVHNAGVRAAE